MRILKLVCIGMVMFAPAIRALCADTFELLDGRTVSGEMIVGSAKEDSVQIRIDEGKYERIGWTNFSQADLKKLRGNPKLGPLVAPYIEISPEEKMRKTEIAINPVPRLDRPPKQSLFGALFSSGVGLLVMLVLYAANLYAGYEVSVFRGHSVALVCGLSAVLPLIGPILFLLMPARAPSTESVLTEQTPEPAPVFTPPQSAESSADPAAPGGLRLSHGEGSRSTSSIPTTQVFQRGAFTFNRRFFETKFPGFFGVVRRDADKDMVLMIRSARGEYVGQRISRIAANDLHLQVQKGGASEEVAIPFSEIQEIQLKHKDA